jgi:hypothetical protein
MDERGGGEGGASKVAAPRTNAELAEIGASLERLLESNQERTFVPEEYLKRRDELTRNAVRAGRTGFAVVCPTESETRRHAAEVVLQMLASPDASPAHLASGLQYLRLRIGDWIRTGEFGLVGHAADVARALSSDAEPAVADAAQALVNEGLGAAELIEGCRHCPHRGAAVAGIAELLRHGDGAILVNLLRSPVLAATEATDSPVFDAIRVVLPTAAASCLKALMSPPANAARPDSRATAGDAKGKAESKPPIDALPPALLPVLGSMSEQDALRVIEALLPHAWPYARYAITGQLFRRNVRWPLSLTESLLKDVMPGIRRLAVMRLVRDNDRVTAARYLAAASRRGEYAADVAVGLAELLRPDRRHPDVRDAYRQWFWSGRRWVGLLSFEIGIRRGAA